MKILTLHTRISIESDKYFDKKYFKKCKQIGGGGWVSRALQTENLDSILQLLQVEHILTKEEKNATFFNHFIIIVLTSVFPCLAFQPLHGLDICMLKVLFNTQVESRNLAS
jgi:hypothetical protein